MLLNIAIGLLMIGITVTIQGYGATYWTRYFVSNYSHLPSSELKRKAPRLLIFTALILLLLNFSQALIWAFTYYLLPGVIEFDEFEKAVYFSLVTFTTLGYGDITISSENRILSGFEAMNGILLLGWSTTMMFSVMQFIWRNALNDDIEINKLK